MTKEIRKMQALERSFKLDLTCLAFLFLKKEVVTGANCLSPGSKISKKALSSWKLTSIIKDTARQCKMDKQVAVPLNQRMVRYVEW